MHWILRLLLWSALISVGCAHVRLTFPPARFPALDFLDTVRTRGPCGVGRPAVSGKGTTTSLEVGSTFNVTWHMAFPHMGGFRIEVIDSRNEPVATLTEGGFVAAENPTQITYEVTLPSNFTCDNCVIRLTRQALEWKSSKYMFWSCADVDIVNASAATRSCSDHGVWTAGQCRCDRLYWGSHCQFKDECLEDADCGLAHLQRAKCRKTGTTYAPRSECYCQAGYFGPKCARVSVLQSEFNASKYQMQEVGRDRDKIYWRIVKESNEIEMILQFKGATWGAVGWRPSNISPTCAADFLAEMSGKKPARDTVGTAEPSPETHAEVEPEPATGSSEPEPSSELTSSAGTAEPATKGEPSSAEPSSGQPEPTPEAETRPGTVAESTATATSRTAVETSRSGTTASISVSMTVGILPKGNPCSSAPPCPEGTRCVQRTIPCDVSPCDTGIICEDPCIKAPPCPEGTFCRYATIPCDSPPCGKGITCARGSSATPSPPPPPVGNPCEILKPCGPNSVCVHEPKQCITTPCPQYRCKEVNMCARRGFCQLGEICYEQPSDCDQPPCPMVPACHLADPADCPANMTMDNCGRTCENSCKNPRFQRTCPQDACEPADCVCKQYYVRDGDRCILPFECPNFDRFTGQPTGGAGVSPPTAQTPPRLACAAFESVDECGSRCEPSCESWNNGVLRPCPAICDPPACHCQKGFVRHPAGQCVLPNKCPSTPVESEPRTNRPFPVAISTARQPVSVINVTPRIIQPSVVTRPPIVTHPPISSSPTTTALPQREPEVIGDVCYGDWRWPAGCRDCDYRISWAYLDDTDEIEFSLETKLPKYSWTGIGFSKTGTMVQADMILIKSVHKNMSIVDAYSDSRNRPKEDPSQDAYTKNIVGTHFNGVLRATFIRKRNTGDTHGDHQFTDAGCFRFLFPVTGGKLGTNGELLRHTTTPIVSKTNVCILSCRGSSLTRPTAEEKANGTCETEYRYPVGCTNATCEYIATWKYDQRYKDVVFTISSRETGRWTGIGFSRNGDMSNSDIITGWVHKGRAYVTDRWAYGRQLPTNDAPDQQDIYDVKGSVVDDVQTISFRRKLKTDDALTDFDLNNCFYYLFPIGGGRILARKSEDYADPKTTIGYHDYYQPRSSRFKICICDDNNIPVGRDDGDEETTAAAAGQRVRRQAPPLPSPADPFSGPDTESITLPPISLPPRPIPALPTRHPLPEPEGTAETAATRDQGPSAEPSTHGEPGHDRDADHSPQPESAAGTSEPNSEPTAEGEPSGNSEPEPEPQTPPLALHAMDCVDMVIGRAKGGQGRVDDYFSVSRATPMNDVYFGGSDDLRAASAFERDGLTTIMFRKKLNSGDRLTDHEVGRGPMTVVWAKGQEKGAYSHPTNSVFDKGQAAHGQQYYEMDVPMYHGATNRGTFQVDFLGKEEVTADDCNNRWVSANGNYHVQWSVNGNMVHFKLTAKVRSGWWTGIGFSKTGQMAEADMVLVKIAPDASTAVLDYWSAGYGPPSKDDQQDVLNTRQRFVNGMLTAEFDRPLTTSDKQNDAQLNDCHFFLFPTAGGPLRNEQIAKHALQPLRSSKPICLSKCAEKVRTTDVPTPSVEPKPSDKPTVAEPPSKHTVLPKKTTPSPNNIDATKGPKAQRRHYRIEVEIVNRKFKEIYKDLEADETKKLSGQVLEAVTELFKRSSIPYKVVEVLEFWEGSVWAGMDAVEIDGADDVTAKKLKKLLDSGADQGLTSNQLLFNKDSSRVFPLYTEYKTAQSNNLLKIVIIVCAALLVLIAIIFAICMICCAKRRSKSRDFSAAFQFLPFQSYMYAYLLNANYAGTYGYGYPLTEKKGVENGAYHPDYRATPAHTRQFSQATTATPNANDASPNTSPNDGDDKTNTPAPDGIGETTYSEWYSKVATRPGSQGTGEGGNGRGPAVRSGGQQPYVSYPNDPYSYYTLNGTNRVAQAAQRGAPTAAPYYRPSY